MNSNASYEDIIFNSRTDAEEALIHMREIADTYGNATVSDFKDLAGLVGSYVDRKYYWTAYMLKYATVCRVHDGWSIDICTPNQHPDPAKITYRDYYKKYDNKSEPKALWITINTEAVEGPDEVMADLFRYVHTITDRDVHITIT